MNTTSTRNPDSTQQSPQVELRSGSYNFLVPISNGPADVPVVKKVIPEALFAKYMSLANRLAITSRIDDGGYFAEIPGFFGLWGDGVDEVSAREDLSDALEDWLLLKIGDGDRDLPILGGVDLNVL